MQKINVQARGKDGQLMAYYNGCENIEHALRIKNEYEKLYNGMYRIISIIFINC